MASELDADIESCLDELQKASGPKDATAERIQIGGKNYPVFVQNIPSDLQLAAGGEIQAAQFLGWIKKSDLPTRPQEGTPVKIRGLILEILNPVTDNRAFWEITIGDYSKD